MTLEWDLADISTLESHLIRIRFPSSDKPSRWSVQTDTADQRSYGHNQATMHWVGISSEIVLICLRPACIYH